MSDTPGGKRNKSLLLALLKASDSKALASAVLEQSYGNRETIFEEGSPFTGLHIVETGQVKRLRVSRGKEQILGIATEGEPIDPVPVLDSGPHSITARARGAVTLYFLPADPARELIWNTPPLFSALLNHVSGQLRELANLAADLAFKDVTARICKILLNLSHDSGEAGEDGIHLRRSLSQSEMAALAGTSREVAWRSLKKLEEEKIIKIERHQITLLAPDRLAALA